MRLHTITAFQAPHSCHTCITDICYFFSSHNYFPPLTNARISNNKVQIIGLKEQQINPVECAGSHETVRLKFTITKQVLRASPTTGSNKNKLDNNGWKMFIYLSTKLILFPLKLFQDDQSEIEFENKHKMRSRWRYITLYGRLWTVQYKQSV